MMKKLAGLTGGEGGIRTPDTVARMPHFECGAFNHSATSPYRSVMRPWCALSRPRAGPETSAPRRAHTHASQLSADQPVERIGAAATQSNGQTDETPHQRVFIATAGPGKAVVPIDHKRNVAELDRQCGRPEPGQQAKRNEDPAAKLHHRQELCEPDAE